MGRHEQQNRRTGAGLPSPKRLGWGAERPPTHTVGRTGFSDAALPYAAAGISVVPLHTPVGNGGCTCYRGLACRSPGKHPRTEHGITDATTDEDRIRDWDDLWPDANVGLRTGVGSGVMVVDVDPRNGGTETLTALEAKNGAFPPTPTAVTGGGGRHYYFRHPGTPVKSVSNALGPGIDVKGDGGQVVAPPSRNEAGPYAWVPGKEFGKVPLADFPPWALARLSRPARCPAGFQPTGRVDTAAVLAGLPEGQRDVELWRLACKFRRADLPQDLAEELIEDAAGNCTPPFPAALAVEKVRRAYRRFAPGGKAAPGTGPTPTVSAQEAAKWLR